MEQVAWLLCILTSKQVLYTPSPGQNHVLTQKQIILNNEWRAEHPFDGRNTQHLATRDEIHQG